LRKPDFNPVDQKDHARTTKMDALSASRHAPDLRWADLSGAHLAGLNLAYADLIPAKLIGSHA